MYKKAIVMEFSIMMAFLLKKNFKQLQNFMDKFVY